MCARFIVWFVCVLLNLLQTSLCLRAIITVAANQTLCIKPLCDLGKRLSQYLGCVAIDATNLFVQWRCNKRKKKNNERLRTCLDNSCCVLFILHSCKALAFKQSLGRVRMYKRPFGKGCCPDSREQDESQQKDIKWFLVQWAGCAQKNPKKLTLVRFPKGCY